MENEPITLPDVVFAILYGIALGLMIGFNL